MRDGALNIQNIILSIVFLLNAGLGVLVYIKGSRPRISASFSIFSWASAGWVLSVLMIFLFKDFSWRLFFLRMTFAVSSIIATAFFYFSAIFPNEKRHVSPLGFISICILSTAFIVLSFTKLIVHSAESDMVTIHYGVGQIIFTMYFISLMSVGILFLIKSFKTSFGLERIQIKYCFLGIFLAFIPSIAANLILPF